MNVSKKNILIKNNNSFLKTKINESLIFSTPQKRNLKLNQNKKYNLTAIDFENNTNIKEDNKKYLLTEFKSNKNNKSKKLLKKNNTGLDSQFSFFIISDKNKSNINNSIVNNQNSKILNPNFEKPFYNINNTFINSSYSQKSNYHSFKNLKRNNTNFSSKATQSSLSLINDCKNRNNKKEIIRNFELNLEDVKTSNDSNLNKIKYIDIHLNDILSKEEEIKRKKIEYLLNKKYKKLFKGNSKLLYESFGYKARNFFNQFNNESKYNIKYEKQKNKNSFNINYVNFKDKLDNIVHKIKIIENNKEFEDLVLSLTDEELNYILNNFNKEILPLLMLKKDNKFFDKNSKQSNRLEGVSSNIIEKNNLNNKYSKLNESKNSLLYKLKQLKNRYKIFPKIILNKNKKISINNENTNIKNNLNNKINHMNKKDINILEDINEEEKDNDYIYKITLHDKKEEIKDDPKLREDLSFLGNSNKLNWDLISEKDKKKGLLLWKKILHPKKIHKKIKRKYKKTKSLNNINISNNSIISEKITEKNLSKSLILESNNNINESNDIKIKFSLELFDSKNLKEKHLVEDFEDENLFENYELNRNNNFNIVKQYPKKNKKYLNKKSHTQKKKVNKYGHNKVFFDDDPEQLEDSEESEESDEDSKEHYFNKKKSNNKKNKLPTFKLNPYPSKVKKDLYFNNYNSNKKYKFNANSPSNGKINTEGNKKPLINWTEFLLEKYKINPGNSFDKNIEKDLNEKENKNKNDKKENEKEDEKKIPINLFGLNVEVKNPKTALQDYMDDRKVTFTELSEQIETKNKLMKLIDQLEKEKKAKRRKKYKKSILFDNDYSKNIISENDNKKIENNKKKGNKDIKKELEKRKTRLFLKFKCDIDFKIKQGEIASSDIDYFSKLKENIDKIMDTYNEKNGNDIEKKMEEYFNEEMDLIEQRRKDENRINEFINDLNAQIYLKSMKKQVIKEKFCNVINYKSVNHMNILNKI